MTEHAILAGGCFWCTEAVFNDVIGVQSVESGYIGGTKENPTYKEVCTGETGHAEAIRVSFDNDQISYGEILDIFLATHDPTQLNRQGPDVGAQYRSGIWYANDRQKSEAEAYLAELRQGRLKGRTIVTQLEPAKTFWPAEEHHQDYIAKTGRACHVADPW